jgi:sugar phosphate permease
MANQSKLKEDEEQDEEKSVWTSAHTATFALMYLAYACGMGTRGGMDLAFFGAQKENVLSVTQFSALLTSGTAAYATGKLLGGPLVDYLGGRTILVTLTSLMGLSFISIGRTKNPVVMSALWSFSRIVHSLGWPAMSVLMRNWFSRLSNGAFINSVLSTSSRAGAWFGPFISGYLLDVLGSWQTLAGGIGTFALAVSATLYTFLKESPVDKKKIRRKESFYEKNQVKNGEADVTVTTKEFIGVAMKEPRLFLLFGASMLTTPVFDLPAVLATYLSETYGMQPTEIGAVASLFPLVAVPAVIGGGYVESNITPSQKTWWYTLTQIVSVGTLIVLSNKPSKSVVPALLLLTMAGIAPAFYVVPSNWLIKFGGERFSGTYNGWLDFPGNFVTTLVYAAFPYLKSRGGWGTILRFYSGLTALGTLSFLLFSVLDARKPMDESPYDILIAKKRKELLDSKRL